MPAISSLVRRPKDENRIDDDTAVLDRTEELEFPDVPEIFFMLALAERFDVDHQNLDYIKGQYAFRKKTPSLDDIHNRGPLLFNLQKEYSLGGGISSTVVLLPMPGKTDKESPNGMWVVIRLPIEYSVTNRINRSRNLDRSQTVHDRNWRRDFPQCRD